MPPKTVKEVVFVCAAAFTGERLKEFRYSNIAGDQVPGGEYHHGFKCGPNNGVFTRCTSGSWKFYNYSYSPNNSVTQFKAVAGKGGIGIRQSLLFHNGKRFKGSMKPDLVNRYRAICEISANSAS